MPLTGHGFRHQMSTRDYFDELYRSESHYWWRHDVRYETQASAFPFSLLTQLTLRFLEDRPGQRVLDLGAGEGSDSIRLALLGHDVSAVEISKVGADKIRCFAAEVNVQVRVQVADLMTYQPDGEFDLIICNGVLHYIPDKAVVVDRMQAATRPGGINVISAWSTYTPVPECHTVVPVYCDDEDGLITGRYAPWITRLLYFEREKKESAHADMQPHSHSHIKLIAQKPR